MNCKILHESSRRMRVRMAQKRMTIKEADMLQYYLEGFDFVKKVVVYERTCDVAIYYKNNKRESVIKRLKKFNYNDTALLENMPNTSGRQITREFQEKMVGMLLSFGVRRLFFPNIINSVYTIVKAAPLVWRGIKCIVSRKLEVDLLDALSVAISIVQGNYSTAGSLMLLLDIGNELEDWTHKKSVDDLARSMSLNVDKVWLVTENEEVSVPISHVKTGDLIRVHTGNVVPLDGEMVSGEAMLNQASLTGESVPVEKSAGSRVYAGTVVEEGECLLRATVTNGQSRYDKIVSMIEDSEKLKSNTENMANRLADRLVWFLSYFGFVNGAFTYLTEEQMDLSLLANIGNVFAWVFAPLGWGTWKPAVAAITGLMAKENVVGTFGILYHVSDVNADTGEGIWQLLRADFTPLTAYSYLIFNLLCAPCIAAMSAIRREMSSIKWFWTAVGYQCVFAYIVAMIIYQVGSLILTGKFGIGTIFGFIGIIAIIYGLVRKPYDERHHEQKAGARA